MSSWSKPMPIKVAAVSVYLLLGFLPLLTWFFLSSQNVTDVMFGFTLYSSIVLMTYIWKPFLFVYIFSVVLVPVFYIAVAAGLERKSRITWTLALISNLVTISADVIWIRIYGADPQSSGYVAGLGFNLVALTILILYWFTIIKENPDV